MKCNFEIPGCGFKFVVSALCAVAVTASALTENPYDGIVGRNAFALKPPTPPASTAPAPVAPPGVELQGLTTILGRPQVLLKIKLIAHAPEPAKDQSVVLDVGQREGDVEVLAIDMAQGAVRLRNQGSELSLNMKDNASKPVAGPALPGVSPMPQPGMMPAAGGSVPPPAPGGGITLPTRQLRSENAGAATGVDPTSLGATTPVISRSREESTALYEVNRAKNEELRKAGVTFPKMPPHPFMNGAEGAGPSLPAR